MFTVAPRPAFSRFIKDHQMASCAVKLGLARVVGSGGPDGTHPRCQVRKEEPWSPLHACAVKLGLARDLWFGGGSSSQGSPVARSARDKHLH